MLFRSKAHNNLASLALSRGRLGEAEAHFREALRLSPGYAPARRGAALVEALRRRKPR